MSNDIVTQVLHDFLAKVNEIPGLEEHAFMVYTDEALKQLEKITDAPAIAMMYGGLLQESDRSRTGMNPWLYVDLFIFPDLRVICEMPEAFVTDGIYTHLADLRNCLKFTPAHCQRAWQFVSETPTEVKVDKDTYLFGYHQRWRVEMHLFNQR